MEFRHLGSLSVLFCLAFLGSHVQASLPAEDYWRSLWPKTPMPKALRDLTQPDSEWKNWSWRARGGTQPKLGDDRINYTKPPSKGSVPTELKGWERGRTQPNIRGPKFINYGKPSSKVSVPTELEDTLDVTYFFERDLHPGKKLNLVFTKRSDDTFLPDRVAKLIPFSTTRFPEILNRFSVEAGSAEAETMRSTLEICEEPGMKGEDKYCATSLESLVNFSVSKLGKNIRLLSTVLEKETQKQQQYSLMDGMQKDGEKAVVCHKLDYPYAVFFCHKVATRAYTVPLVAADGKKAKALAVCHPHTEQWSPEHIAFQQLHVKPGTVPICHFLATDTLLWVPN